MTIINIPSKRTIILSIILVLLSVFFIIPLSHAYAQSPFHGEDFIYIDLVPTARYGHEAVNPDGSYYPGDPITFTWGLKNSIPTDDPIDVVANVDTQYQIVRQGSNFLVINSTASMPYKIYTSTVTIQVLKESTGYPLLTYSKVFTHRLVPYNPEFHAFPYTVLNDAKRYSYEDRTGVIINYIGSKGNVPLDNTIYPDRRLMLYENFTSVVTGQEFTFADVGGYKVPSGVRESETYDVLDIGRESNDPLIYMEKAGYQKFYYNTIPLNMTAIQGANSMNMTVIYYFKDSNIDYKKEVEYAMPNPRHSIANTFKVLVLPSTPTNVTLSTQDGYQSMQDYAYDQALKATQDPEVAELVREDIPPSMISVTDEYGEIEIKVSKMSVYQLPIWYNETDFGAIMDTSFTPITVNISTKYGDWRQEYGNYLFDQDYSINLDTRQNTELQIWRATGSNSYNIKAEWDIISVDTNNHSKVNSCISKECSLGIINNSTNMVVKAYNEFGGSGIATVPPFKESYNPLNNQVLGDFWLVIIILGALGAFLIVVIKLLNHWNK